jgi:hypothetical protein
VTTTTTPTTSPVLRADGLASPLYRGTSYAPEFLLAWSSGGTYAGILYVVYMHGHGRPGGWSFQKLQFGLIIAHTFANSSTVPVPAERRDPGATSLRGFVSSSLSIC